MRLGRRAFIGLAGTAAAGVTAAALGRDRIFGDDAPAASGPPMVPTPFSGNASTRQDWDALAREAKREGTLFVIVSGQRAYRRVTNEFQTAFPGIDVQLFTENTSDGWLERVRADRRASRYTLDLAFVQPEPAITQGQKDGFWTPLRPLLIRPDVMDDAAWRGGFASRFLDARGQFCFAWEYQVQHSYSVDGRAVKDGEITSVRDLLDPKWRGKVITSDPRSGLGLFAASNVARQQGNDVVKRLLVEQQPKVALTTAELTEAIASGAYPVAQGVRVRTLQTARGRGEAGHVKFLDLPDADSTSGTGLLAFNNTPHPAAARLFLNWVLTREGQTLMAQHLVTNSARTDVEMYEKDGAGQPGKPYYEPDREANYAHTAATQGFVRGLLGT